MDESAESAWVVHKISKDTECFNSCKKQSLTKESQQLTLDPTPSIWCDGFSEARLSVDLSGSILGDLN